MANNPSSLANTANMYPHSGIHGRILPNGYSHFADSLQEQINRGGSSYITVFPSGWDENVAEKERYRNLDDLQNANEVFFPIHTSGINLNGANASYTASPGGIGHSSMSNIFG
jgi:hypothetical protein